MQICVQVDRSISAFLRRPVAVEPTPTPAEILKRAPPDEGEGGDALVFPGRNGAPLDASVAFRAVKTAAVKAGVPWAGLHTLRHTCASLLFARGENPKTIQRWLGHHRASFTLDTYVHLIESELPDGLDVEDLHPDGDVHDLRPEEDEGDADLRADGEVHDLRPEGVDGDTKVVDDLRFEGEERHTEAVIL